MFNARNLTFLLTVLAGVALDQATKAWVTTNFLPGLDELPVVPNWLSVVHVQNTGAAFSTMEGQLPLFLVFTLIAVPVILDLVRRQARDTVVVPLSLGLILAGALGNGIDRLRQGYVTDFLKAYAGQEPLRSWLNESRAGTNVWPIFNVADSLLLVGVALFGLYWLLLGDSEVPDEGKDADEAAESAS